MQKSIDLLVVGAAGLGLVASVACGPKHINTPTSKQPKLVEAINQDILLDSWQLPDFNYLMPDFMHPLRQEETSKALTSRIEAEKWLYNNPANIWEAQGTVTWRGELMYGDAVHIQGESKDRPDTQLYAREYIIQTECEQIFAVVKYSFRQNSVKTGADLPPHIFNVGDKVHVKFSGQFKTDDGIMYYRFKENNDRFMPMMEIQMYKILSRADKS